MPHLTCVLIKSTIAIMCTLLNKIAILIVEFPVFVADLQNGIPTYLFCAMLNWCNIYLLNINKIKNTCQNFSFKIKRKCSN